MVGATPTPAIFTPTTKVASVKLQQLHLQIVNCYPVMDSIFYVQLKIAIKPILHQFSKLDVSTFLRAAKLAHNADERPTRDPTIKLAPAATTYQSDVKMAPNSDAEALPTWLLKLVQAAAATYNFTGGVAHHADPFHLQLIYKNWGCRSSSNLPTRHGVEVGFHHETPIPTWIIKLEQQQLPQAVGAPHLIHTMIKLLSLKMPRIKGF